MDGDKNLRGRLGDILEEASAAKSVAADDGVTRQIEDEAEMHYQTENFTIQELLEIKDRYVSDEGAVEEATENLENDSRMEGWLFYIRLLLCTSERKVSLTAQVILASDDNFLRT